MRRTIFQQIQANAQAFRRRISSPTLFSNTSGTRDLLRLWSLWVIVSNHCQLAPVIVSSGKFPESKNANQFNQTPRISTTHRNHSQMTDKTFFEQSPIWCSDIFHHVFHYYHHFALIYLFLFTIKSFPKLQQIFHFMHCFRHSPFAQDLCIGSAVFCNHFRLPWLVVWIKLLCHPFWDVFS